MDLSGDWKVEVDFVLGAATHALHLEQEGDRVTGRYHTAYGDQELSGEVGEDGLVRMRSSVHYQACGAGYAFRGRVDGDRMEGELGLGEYWTATWRAVRTR